MTDRTVTTSNQPKLKPARTPPAPQTPSTCIKVCRLDAHDVCVGCGRHIDEIVAAGRVQTPQL